MARKSMAMLMISGLGLMSLFGCTQQQVDSMIYDQYTLRSRDVDAAYQRGEITFEQKSQMQSQIQQDRLRGQQQALMYLQSYQQANQANQSRIIYQPSPGYNIYNQNGEQVGTLRPR